MQDVDSNFLNKSNLEANVETLAQEIDFLKTLYMEVRAHPLSAIWDQCLAWTPWQLPLNWHIFKHLVSYIFPPTQIYILYMSMHLPVEKVRILSSLTQIYE